MQVIAESNRKPIKCWTGGVEIEDEARQQLLNVAALPFIYKHLAVMPDVHWGMGATVGSVVPTLGAIVPAAVGVDIGCGMVARRTSLTASDLPYNLKGVRDAIEQAIPHGRTDNGSFNDVGSWQTTDAVGWKTATPLVVEAWDDLAAGHAAIMAKHPKIVSRNKPEIRQLGTLGTGNHFVEVCLDEEQRVWVMLHSGSRGVGNAIGRYFIERAKEECRRWYVPLPDPDLAYLPETSALFTDYVQAVEWAQEYARMNRLLMMRHALDALAKALGRPFLPGMEVINCHHNYVAREHHFGQNILVTRKGAVRAREGDLGIIPGSMGARSFIVRGKGNADSFHSCSHGAGRRMSRGAARKLITLEDHIKATEGVECRKDAEVIDESPAAYKDIDAVMAAQRDLVEIVHTLKQVVCVKG